MPEDTCIVMIVTRTEPTAEMLAVAEMAGKKLTPHAVGIRTGRRATPAG